MESKFIVAEVSKNWQPGYTSAPELLSHRFETVINHNDKRGYELVEWKLSSVIDSKTGFLNETIIAIFKKV